MEPQTIINAVLGVAAFLCGWVLNNITKTIDRLDSEAREVPRIYVAKEDYRRDIDELKSICQQIFDKLDAKADK